MSFAKRFALLLTIISPLFPIYTSDVHAASSSTQVMALSEDAMYDALFDSKWAKGSIYSYAEHRAAAFAKNQSSDPSILWTADRNEFVRLYQAMASGSVPDNLVAYEITQQSKPEALVFLIMPRLVARLALEENPARVKRVKAILNSINRAEQVPLSANYRGGPAPSKETQFAQSLQLYQQWQRSGFVASAAMLARTALKCRKNYTDAPGFLVQAADQRLRMLHWIADHYKQVPSGSSERYFLLALFIELQTTLDEATKVGMVPIWNQVQQGLKARAQRKSSSN